MIAEFQPVALIENQPHPAAWMPIARLHAVGDPAQAQTAAATRLARATPPGGHLAPVLLPLAVRPSPIWGLLENSNLGSHRVGSGGLHHG